MATRSKLQALASRWAEVTAGERANYQLYLGELAEALGVPRPQPAGSGYQFELPIRMVNPDGSTTTRFADLVKDGAFLLEAKDAESGKSTDLLLRRAFGQATQYAAFVPNGAPPYLLVLDVGTTLLVWDRWSGTYGGFQSAHRIDLRTLADSADDIALLQDIWTRPLERDPRARANFVTREIADKLAHLATELEAQGLDNERVARFLMRCVFTMFAEDVDLVPDHPFQAAIELGFQDPDDFSSAVRDLWAAMDEGKRFGLRRLLRFNGHFFKDQEVLPVSRKNLVVLHEAAKADWANVEPTIFGTLLVRALDPIERHTLGAEYTPREFVQRLVRPTIEDPVRESWALVQAEVLQLREQGRAIDLKRATERLRAFHAYLRGLRVLDPACGSGNFLYVALATLKSIELEVLREIEAITGAPEIALEEVGPWQFYGIEVKPWARELAELTLWVGYYQWWRQTHGHTQPPEPVLRETGTLECRDAVLAWDDVQHVPARDRPDPTPKVADPVTGKLVPDPKAKLRYVEYLGARQADWPEADFIVGNPPYIGNKRMREAFGDGYVEALRGAYAEIPESADYVMYWWERASRAVGSGRTLRAGLITTNSITQAYNRSVVAGAETRGVRVVWAVPSHPWVDEAGSAAVRVAMTVMAAGDHGAVRVDVDDDARVIQETRAARLNADLTAHADVPAAASVPLRANSGISSRGFTLVGRGFVLDAEEATPLRERSETRPLVRPYLNGKDLSARPRGVYVIDFGLLDEVGAREHPVLFDLVRTRVKPGRDANKRASYRKYWWRFGEPRVTLRDAVEGLPRFIATPYVSKHRFFVFLDAEVAPDEKVVVAASDDPFVLGVLSSRFHEEWALAAGSRLGIGNDPTYNNSTCFDPFPFPSATELHRQSIVAITHRLEKHRADALAREKKITMTGMYNVVEKLRTGQDLTEKEREIHDLAACGVLRDIHDDLDAAVAEAYGWPTDLSREEILERMVRLHDERVLEEDRGVVRWLRPGYQKGKFGADLPDTGALGSLALGVAAEEGTPPPDWPANVPQQLEAIRAAIAEGPKSLADLRSRFPAAKRASLVQHLEALGVLGLIREASEGQYVAVGLQVSHVA